MAPSKEPKYLEYITDIKQSGVHLLEVINEILDISKVESGTVALNQNMVEFGDIIETCHRLVTPRAQDKNLLLAIETVGEIPVIRGDRRRIIQLLLNLLSNAVKFTGDGGRIVSRIRQAENGDLELSVSDTGVGIASENLEKAMKPFFQVGGTLSRPHEGTGLGLTLCKMFAELHGGSLVIVSEIGKGTVVTASFPAELAQDKDNVLLSQAADG